MSKIFLDCGTHLFQGFKQFVSMYNINSDWECYAFEANPITYNISKSTYEELIKIGFKINHLNSALSNNNGNIKVNCAMSPEGDSFTNQGSNILKNPPSRDKVYGGIFNYDNSKEFTVNTINFSEFLKKVTNEEDFVLIKMDIEGSEFDVLDSLIESGDFKLIDEIYVEFHERFFDDTIFYINKKNTYKKIFEENNIIFKEWI
jgi:FkbM family methyltransferase